MRIDESKGDHEGSTGTFYFENKKALTSVVDAAFSKAKNVKRKDISIELL
jgi:hypothetical protein